MCVREQESRGASERQRERDALARWCACSSVSLYIRLGESVPGSTRRVETARAERGRMDLQPFCMMKFVVARVTVWLQRVLCRYAHTTDRVSRGMA